MTGRIKESVEQQAADVARDWVDSPYYADAERWTFLFWDGPSPFRAFFDRLDLATVIELACGHGRHAERYADGAGRVILLDVLPENIDHCKRRHRDRRSVVCMANSGVDFQPIPAGSATAIVCYDAMVHFPPDVVASYLMDARRVLAPGGRGLFHHSNYAVPFNHPYGMNPHARNYMSQSLFGSLAVRAGLEVEDSRVISWGHEPDLDCITLVRRAA